MRKVVYVSIILIFLFPVLSKAWDCVMKTIESNVKSSKYIVTGRVVRLLDTMGEAMVLPDTIIYRRFREGYGYDALLVIDKVYKWKGRKQDTIRVYSMGSIESISFKEGNEYLLFMIKEKQSYYVPTCSYSSELAKADNYIRVIDSMLTKRN